MTEVYQRTPGTDEGKIVPHDDEQRTSPEYFGEWGR